MARMKPGYIAPSCRPSSSSDDIDEHCRRKVPGSCPATLCFSSKASGRRVSPANES